MIRWQGSEPVHGELTGSNGYRSLIQAPAVPPRTGTNRGRLIIQLLPQAVPTDALPARMRSMAVIVMLKSIRFTSRSDVVQNKIRSRYSRRIVPISRSGRKRRVRNSLDFGYLEDPKISLPWVE